VVEGEQLLAVAPLDCPECPQDNIGVTHLILRIEF
jgi:hypothetical protein